MKKVLVLMAILAIAIAIPASAQFTYTWSDNFDWANGGSNISGQNGWFSPTATTSPKVETTLSLSPLHSIKQVPGVRSFTERRLTGLNSANSGYYTALATFWVWDNMAMGGTGATAADTRVGMYSTAGVQDSGAMTYAQAVGITTSRPAGNTNWYVYASSGFVPMDGGASGAASTSSLTGYTLTSVGCAPAVRKAGWNLVRMYSTYDVVTGQFAAYYFVNPDFENGPFVNATLTGTSAAGRINNIKSIAGVFAGSGSTFSNNLNVDDVYFSGEGIVPEPGSFMALGAGLVGLVGMIRRKR